MVAGLCVGQAMQQPGGYGAPVRVTARFSALQWASRIAFPCHVVFLLVFVCMLRLVR